MRRLIFKGPVLTASGYGEHSRQLLSFLLGSGQFDIGVVPIAWGNTAFLLEQDPFLVQIRQLAAKCERDKQAGVQYDVSVQVTIPNEFERLARINIGVTAGIEVDRVSPAWIAKANDVIDLLVVPSTHSAQTYGGVQYQTQDGKLLKLAKPLFLCPEGVDTSVFNEGAPAMPLELETGFNFITVGLGLDKGIGEDRKNISTLIKWFLERFKDDRDVGLVLKVGLMGNSLLDLDAVRRRIDELRHVTGCVGQFPRIYLIHGRLTPAQMAGLYRHPRIKAYVTLTHGEGYGLPIIEAAACGLPVLATDWSGHLDFLTVAGKKKFVPIEFTPAEIPQSCVWQGVMEAGSHWANPKEDDAKLKMKKIVMSYDRPKEWARELAKHIGEHYSLEVVGKKFNESLLQFVDQFDDTHPATADDLIRSIHRRLDIRPGQRTLLYTMPMSAGDVFVSTAVVDSLKKKFPDHRIFFATSPQYNDILRDNPDIDRVIPWEQWMADVPLLERMFTQVFTPNLAIQTLSANWVRGGKGRRLADEMAAQCGVELGDYKIRLDAGGAVEGLPVRGRPESRGYVVLHPGSGKGQWEARNYLHWQEVVNNIMKLACLPVYQVGSPEDPLYQGCYDLRGKTTYNQLACVVKEAECLVGIDTVSTHMAAALGTPHVALYGSSYANSTGPVCKRLVPSFLLETPNRYTCEKACYKYQCAVDGGHPCVNEIEPKTIVGRALDLLGKPIEDMTAYQEHRPKIAGYTHVLDAESRGYPYLESIRSMLGFCDEVVVVDGGSTDGTAEKIRAIDDPRLKVFVHRWDWTEPGMDGMQKAYGRAMCSVGPDDFLWQQDADEVVSEDDYGKIRRLVKRFPRDVDILDLPVAELWGSSDRVRTDRHSWKWRLSRNNFRITHGINRAARVVDPKTGRTYAKKGQSDGCEYIDVMTGEYLPHRNFYTTELDRLRQTDPQEYGRRMNVIFSDMPSIFHYSWADLPQKIRNFKKFWDRCWSNLYNDPKPEDRFPDVETEEQIGAKAVELDLRGGEHGKAETFLLDRKNPTIISDWLSQHLQR
jgi:ADP-heptose:LPS heptosyltransferase/glycosyltransferase involved in cell wall biosynthesis